MGGVIGSVGFLWRTPVGLSNEGLGFVNSVVLRITVVWWDEGRAREANIGSTIVFSSFI